MDNDAEWLTVLQAADLSGYHPEQIRRLIRAEQIDARKFSFIWQVSRSSLIAYVKKAQEIDDKRYGPKRIVP